MRYSLTHVLRIVSIYIARQRVHVNTNTTRQAIFFTIIVLYTILAHHLRKVASQAYSAAPISDSSSETSIISGSSAGKKGGETRQERELRRKRRVIRAAILRLITFPAAYVILWLPGMVNRRMCFFSRP